MIPLKQVVQTRKKAYIPEKGVLRITQLPSTCGMHIEVKCLDLKRGRSLAWQTRIKVCEVSPGYLVYVDGEKSGGPPKGQFQKLAAVLANELKVKLTDEKYLYRNITTQLDPGDVHEVTIQDPLTGRLKGLQFTSILHSKRRDQKRPLQVEFVQINNAKIPKGEYEGIIRFLEQQTGLTSAPRFLQAQFDF